jgi:hypothetical protein
MSVNKQWRQTPNSFPFDKFETNKEKNLDPSDRPRFSFQNSFAKPSLNVSVLSTPAHSSEQTPRTKFSHMQTINTVHTPVNLNKVIEINVNNMEPHLSLASHRLTQRNKHWQDKLDKAHMMDYQDQQEMNSSRA